MLLGQILKSVSKNFQKIPVKGISFDSRKVKKKDVFFAIKGKKKSGIKFNWAVLGAWAISFGVFYFISIQYDVFLSFLTLPAWITCGALFLIFSKYFQRKII